jgi:aryl-alcohol dehydrogenase-like predicted oxidoreductase
MDAARNFSFPLRLGFGCSGAWAQKWFPEREARAALIAALEAGVRHVDTAGFYAGGEAERRLAAVLKEFREPVFVSTKTGTRYLKYGGALKDFTPIGIRTDVEASLKRLGRERIDLLYLHGPSNRQLAEALPTLSRLKKEGKIALAGVCGEGAGLARAVETEGVDVIMGVYNIFRREHRAAFARGKEKGVGVVAIAPLAQGLYRRDFLAPRSLADGWRIARALVKNRTEFKRARAARETLDVEGWTAAQLALAFVHANPAIDVAVTTSTNPAHIRETARAAGRPAAPEIVAKLAAIAP